MASSKYTSLQHQSDQRGTTPSQRPTTRRITPGRQPEHILALEADRRVSTASSQKGPSLTTNQNQANTVTSQSGFAAKSGITDSATTSYNNISNESPTKNKKSSSNGSSSRLRSKNDSPSSKILNAPDNTPRLSDDATTMGVAEMVSLVGDLAVRASVDEQDEVLEPDEMFMELKDEDRKQWEDMMKSRSEQLEASKQQHQKWYDAFTRRRMFAYSRMRKLHQTYVHRVQFFNQMSQNLAPMSNANGASRRHRSLTSLPSKHGQITKQIEKRMSEPHLKNTPSDNITDPGVVVENGPSNANSETLSDNENDTMRRNETMIGTSNNRSVKNDYNSNDNRMNNDNNNNGDNITNNSNSPTKETNTSSMPSENSSSKQQQLQREKKSESQSALTNTLQMGQVSNNNINSNDSKINSNPKMDKKDSQPDILNDQCRAKTPFVSVDQVIK